MDISFLQFFTSDFSNTLAIIAACGGLCLLIAIVLRIMVGLRGTGNDKMLQGAQQIRKGVMLFVWLEYRAIILFSILVTAAIYVFLDTGIQSASLQRWSLPYYAVSFGVGVLSLLIIDFIGFRTALSANIRVANAARTSLGKSLKIAIWGGQVYGFLASAFVLAIFAAGILLMMERLAIGLPQALPILVMVALGVSCSALFLRSNGTLLSAAQGKTEENEITEHMRSIAGFGSELFTALCSSLASAMLLAMSTEWGPGTTETAILFPLILIAIGIACSFVGCLFIRTSKGERDIENTIRGGLFLSVALLILASFFLSQTMLPETVWVQVFESQLAGIIAGVVLLALVLTGTHEHSKQVHALTERAKLGSAVFLQSGLLYGFTSLFWPIVILAICLWISFDQAGTYGIAMSAVGLVSLFAITMSIAGFLPIAQNAHALSEHGKLPKQVKMRTESLLIGGKEIAAYGKVFSLISGCYATLVLILLFTDMVGLQAIDILNVQTLLGLFAGVMTLVILSGIIMQSIHQVTNIIGKKDDKQTEDQVLHTFRRGLSTAIKEHAFSLFMIIVSPMIVGFVLGSESLAAYLVGTLTAVLLMSLPVLKINESLRGSRAWITAGNVGGESGAASKVVNEAESIWSSVGVSISTLTMAIMAGALIAVVTAGMYELNGLVG